MIRIIGPRDKRVANAINTTSRAGAGWTSGLSPFNLGPVHLYGEHSAQIFENAWQYAKLYQEHADLDGNPTEAYWPWAKAGWKSTIPHRYPLGKGRRPLSSLWNGERLGYIEARKRIYLPLYRDLVKQTEAFRRLQQIYQEQRTVTLFDFDGYDHHQSSMTLSDVLNCPTKICGHAFVLAMMLTHGPEFTVNDVEAAGDGSESMDNQRNPETRLYPITVVNKKTFHGHCEYIGRQMRNLSSSPLGNPYRVKPFGPYERDESVFTLYKQWLWREMRKADSPALKELLRLKQLAETGPLNIACWCAPLSCHGEIIRSAIEYLSKQESSGRIAVN